MTVQVRNIWGVIWRHFGMMASSAASATMPTTSITTIFIGNSIA